MITASRVMMENPKNIISPGAGSGNHQRGRGRLRVAVQLHFGPLMHAFWAQAASIVSTAFPRQACTKSKEETILAKTALLNLLVLAR
jgi:hypothetical protein